ncbi:MAG: hypothetical protein DBY39_04735 [Clostridiales bacterium]|nr:MAG: hypothetical protein DBY39_04735 [Clostridiales bacterium]
MIVAKSGFFVKQGMKKFIVRELAAHVRENERSLPGLAAKKLNIRPEEIQAWGIVRKSLDARKKDNLQYKYTLWVEPEMKAVSRLEKKGWELYQTPQQEQVHPGTNQIKGRIVVVGAGPCGLFAAYILAQNGYHPLLIERGKAIEQREKDFDLLQREGALNPESNACFGEGGAGAFSDGKLTARNKDPHSAQVMSIFIAHGASEEIAYYAKPHLGTDHIRRIIASMRREILEKGGEILFETRLERLIQQNGALTGIVYSQQGIQTQIDCNACILAIGHSARDTFSMLQEAGLILQPKPFAMGVRIEHRRELIDQWQYGKFAEELGAAEYTLKAQVQGKGVYSFCMCPGGEVICSATQPGHTAVNGMSWHDRNQPYSNSAIVVSVGTEDMPAGVLGGIALQQQLERAAYQMAGGYGAPAQTYRDFIDGRASKKLPTNSYRPYTVGADLSACLPGFIRNGIIGAARHFEGAIPGFIQQGLMIGVETRTSSPVRIMRNEQMCSNLEGLYPGGEGAGYAGGIMSAAIDGIKLANQLIRTFQRPIP